jgi:hypothetical protein
MNHSIIGAGRTAAALCATSFLLTAGALVGATSASARPDSGPRRVVSVDSSTLHCTLHRVGPEFARCDDQTGNGVPAPSWVPMS